MQIAHMKGPKKDGKREPVYYASHANYVEGLDEVFKIYDTTGDNRDGAMSQAATTNALNSKASTDTATTSTAGLMSAADKTKLNGLSNYSLPAATNSSLGGVKLYSTTGTATDGTMSQAATTNALKSKASTDTATTSTAGLMSADDKTKLNGLSNYSLPTATKSSLGGVKIYDATGTATDGTITQAGITNAVNELKGEILLPIIIATAPSGSTVVAKNADTTLTATVKNGNWHFIVPNYGYWTVHVTTTAGVHLSKTVNVNDVKIYRVSPDEVKVYGYRISKTESDPAACVEYLYDAEGFTPAAMNYETGEFDYGSWADAWFVTENRPCMVKNDGTVDYYLDPNDYTKKEDGETASDVANTSYAGNAMAQIPLVWVYRYEDDDYYYEIVSNIQYDENYKAYAHTKANGSIADYFYSAMFGASGNASKLRSLSGQTLSQTLTTEQQLSGATANGDGWYIGTWSQHELIRTLLVLMGKSTDTQTVFGNGNLRQATAVSGLLATGTLKDKGQFYGYKTNNQQVKVFHIEGFWGDQWLRTAGLINYNGKIYVKMTPAGQGYRVLDVVGYTNTDINTPTASQSFISKMSCSEYGMIPTAVTGSGSTYFCDAMWSNNAQLDYLFVGCCALNALAFGGAFCFYVIAAPSSAYWYYGCALSFV